MESVLEEYRASLGDLTFNSKPLINMLTVLAEENFSYASDLVKLIELQVYQSPPNQRLPVLYLIDSVVKSYSPYVKLFSVNLIKTFVFVFEKADTKVRQDLFKLRNTWNGMFSKTLLRDLDIAVRQFDRNWPIKRLKKTSKGKPPKENSSKLSLTHSIGLTVEERVAAMVGNSGESSAKQSSDEEEDNEFYGDDDAEGGDYLVEEEEILVDEEKLDELEALEKELLKRKAELSRLESIGEAPIASIASDTPKSKTQVPYFIDAKSLQNETEVTRRRSRSKSPETEVFPAVTTNEPQNATLSSVSTPDDNLFVAENTEMSTQTVVKVQVDVGSQAVVEMKDEVTQFRHRKKTKNFISQYRVSMKSVGTYFRMKTRDADTQYAPPLDTPGIAADSTSSHPDGGTGVFTSKERSALKDYVAVLKDDFLPKGYSKHSGIVLRNLCAQRRQGLLCDITLGAEGRVFKAHRSVLAASSDFFYTLFAHEEIEKTPLSHIELQGITAKALSLVLDYIYTSILPVGSLTCIEEIIIAAKRLQIQTLIMTCPALERAVARKIDMAGWLISNALLLSPSNKHPYVEALRTLKDLESSTSYFSSTYGKYAQNAMAWGGDAGAGDFICHADRDVSSKKRTADMAGYDVRATDEGKHKKRKRYDRGSETESDVEVSSLIKGDAKKDENSMLGMVPSPGMPPNSWPEGFSPNRSGKKTATREPAVYKCNNCSRHIISRRNYIAHCEAHLRKGEKPYGCSLCKKMFVREELLEVHLRKIHSELSEDEIEAFTKSKVNAADAGEVMKQRGLEQFSPTSGKKVAKITSRNCPECRISLPDESAFLKHLKIRHPDVAADYKYKCRICKQYFKTPSARTTHMRKHKKESENAEKNRKVYVEMNSDSDNEWSSGEKDDGNSSEEEQKHIKKGSNHVKNTDSQVSETVSKLKLYHCKICGEMFSIQCFYKAHVAGHKKDLEEK